MAPTVICRMRRLVSRVGCITVPVFEGVLYFINDWAPWLGVVYVVPNPGTQAVYSFSIWCNVDTFC